MNDRDMPQGWHQIKSILVKEIKTASNFHLCIEYSDALFHARLLGEKVARDTKTQHEESSGCESGSY